MLEIKEKYKMFFFLITTFALLMYFSNMCSLRDATPDSFIPPAQNLTLKHLSSIVGVDKFSSSSSAKVSRRREEEDNAEVVTAAVNCASRFSFKVNTASYCEICFH